MLIIYKNEDRTVELKFLKQLSDGTTEPFPLTGVTAMTVKLPTTTATPLEKTLLTGVTVTNAEAGKASVALSDADTALLKEGEKMSFVAVVDKGTERRICVFDKVLTVRKSPL
jgi:hypothetical protein